VSTASGRADPPPHRFRAKGDSHGYACAPRSRTRRLGHAFPTGLLGIAVLPGSLAGCARTGRCASASTTVTPAGTRRALRRARDGHGQAACYLTATTKAPSIAGPSDPRYELPRIRVECGEGAAALLRGLRAGGDPLIERSSRLATVCAELMRPYKAFLLSAALLLVALVAMILLPEGPWGGGGGAADHR
jgi:hypothetical protein